MSLFRIRCLAIAALSLAVPFGLGQGVAPDQAATYAKLYQKTEAQLRIQNFKDALPNLEKLAQIYPHDGDIQFQLGQALLNQDRPADAISHYKRALELGAFANKFKAGALYDLACCYCRIGEPADGMAWFRQSLDAGFRDLAHARSDSDLTPLRSHKDWKRLTGQDDVTKMSRNDAWRYDLWFLNRELRRIHLNPYRLFTTKQFDDYVKRLNSDIPKLNDEQIVARFQRLMAMAGDGHTGLRPASNSTMVRQIPLQAFWFEDGLYITSASKEHAALAGAKITAIEGLTVEEAFQEINPFLSQDNQMNAKAVFSGRLVFPALFFGAGISKKSDALELSLVNASGGTQTVTLSAGTAAPDETWITARSSASIPEPLYLKNRNKAYFAEPLPELNAMYMQYNAVRNDASESLADFTKRVFQEMDEKNVQRLILDVRWNGGGNTFLSRPIHEAIMRRERLNQVGNLFLITGRNTFSAAQNFTTDITRFSNPITVGEPTGSSPNFVGETVRFTLPFCKAQCSVSDLYWQRSWPMDHRNWIAPKLPAPPVFSLYKENRDPAMEAIRTYILANP